MEGSAKQNRHSARRTLNTGISTGQLAALLACSAQHVRNLERDGVLPPSTRAANGYRRFNARHLHAARAYAALSTALGPVEAKCVLREVLAAEPVGVARLMDELHARLHTERTALRRAIDAAEAISAEVLRSDPADAMPISELAGALDVRTSTLRHWESEGLLAPERRGRTRSYSPAEVQQARIVDQLRRAGYRIPDLRPVLDQLRRIGFQPDVAELLLRRGRVLDDRSAALLTAGAHLLELSDTTGV